MSNWIYSIIISIYQAGFSVASLWNRKANLRVKGLKAQRRNYKHTKSDKQSPSVLIHCASMGEYQQAKPILDWILEHTNYDIQLSFFSSSAHDAIPTSKRITKYYLPVDKKSAMSLFLDFINPQIIIIVKNEWWWNMLSVIAKKQIPTYQISATIRKEHYFIKHPISFFRTRLQVFKQIFVIDQGSLENLKTIFIGNITIAGDSRKDQVLKIKQHAVPNVFLNRKKVIIFGSIWSSDIDTIIDIIKFTPGYIHILFPHEVGQKNIDTIKYNFKNIQLINNLNEISEIQNNVSSNNIYLVTKMGILKSAYCNASLAYVGGGYGDGIHNILEPAVFNIPTLIGPNYTKSNEAINLIHQKCVLVIKTKNQTKIVVDKAINSSSVVKIKLEQYFTQVESTTSIICKSIFAEKNI
ncbi:MAG: glycosyltransferase N-terminal domain-containing protein [Saprospiraceae bacterium]